MLIRTSQVILIFAILLAGCQGNDERQPDEELLSEDEVQMNEPFPAADASADYAPLTVPDIARWQRGMEAELRGVNEAREALRRAENAEDTLEAMMAANDMSTLAAGARAAGVSDERYNYIRQNLSTAVKYLTPLEQEMDVSQMPEAMVQQFEQSRQASLDQMGEVIPPDVMAALRSEAEALRRQDLTLTQERLRAAGIGG